MVNLSLNVTWINQANHYLQIFIAKNVDFEDNYDKFEGEEVDLV